MWYVNEERRNVYKILIGKHEGKCLFRRHSSRLDVNIREVEED